MQFPAICIDKDTQKKVYVPKLSAYTTGKYTYVHAMELETLDTIKKESSSDHDMFMALKSKGWKNLNKEERQIFQTLKLTEAQLVNPI